MNSTKTSARKRNKKHPTIGALLAADPKPNPDSFTARQGDAPSLRDDQTPPAFAITADGCDVLVKVPVAICDAGHASIVGREWGPDNRQLRKCDCTGWIYWLDDPAVGSSVRFSVSEAELLTWQRRRNP